LLMAALVVLAAASCQYFDSNPPNASALPTQTATIGAEPTMTATLVPGQQAAGGIRDFFPFEPDVYYEYAGQGNEYAPMDAYVDYVYDDSIQLSYDNGGTVMGRLYKYRDGQLLLVKSVGEFYIREDLTQYEEDMQEIVLKEPIAVGTAWQNGEEIATITSVNSIVDTPLGQFEAIEVTAQNPSITTKKYYARGMGFIKMVISGEYEIIQELERRDAGVPLETFIRFYYPKMTETDVELVYSDIRTEMFTNMGLADVLAQHMKTPPDASLQPVMSANARINKVYYDGESTTAYVDLTKEFITEMNAGSATEGAILDSLTNTICNIYGASKMMITIDGQPYESGHVAFAEGEALVPKYENAAEWGN